MIRNRRKWTFLFAVIPLTVYIVIVIIPLLSSFYYSFTDWNGFRQTYNFVGLDNFTKVFSDKLFANAIKNTLIWMVAALILPVGGGLILHCCSTKRSKALSSTNHCFTCRSAFRWLWLAGCGSGSTCPTGG